MDAKEAVAKAKAYVTDLFQAEQIQNIGLEEIEFDDRDRTWFVTIGFSRPWEAPGLQNLSSLTRARAYKVVRMTDAGTVVSVKDRRLVAA